MNDRIITANKRNGVRQYFNSNFFIQSDTTGSTGTTDEEDNSNAFEINLFNNKKEKILSQDNQVFAHVDEEYDLNEADLSDSDQTESCILNDANNDLLEFTDEEKIKTRKYLNGALIDSGADVLKPLDDEKSNKRVKNYRSVSKKIKFKYKFIKILKNICFKNSIGLNSVKERISCIIYLGNEWKGVDLSMLEISNCIIMNVKKAFLPVDYFYVGMVFSILIGCKFQIIYFLPKKNIFN